MIYYRVNKEKLNKFKIRLVGVILVIKNVFKESKILVRKIRAYKNSYRNNKR